MGAVRHTSQPAAKHAGPRPLSSAARSPEYLTDLVIYNTCAVRENAEDRVFGNVGALKNKKHRNPDMIIGLCGCMMQQEHISEKIKKSYPHVDIVFHLTGRLLGKREPIDVDIDAIIAAAKRTGTILEINAYPERADIKDEYIRKCIEAGVKMSIDSDAHSVKHFQYLSCGIAQARRGWAEKKDIINAWPVDKMLTMLK